MPGSTATGSSREWYQPTLARLLFAGLLAGAGFLLPQEAPLEWYPLNEPGDDVLYLEITCAADRGGEVRIYYDTTRGTNELESMRWPISPTAQPYTYTFPLPDAPLLSLRLDPVGQGGTLYIRQLRIVDRRGTEIQRFPRDAFYPNNQIAAIAPRPDGWTITTTPGARGAFSMVDFGAPLVPAGMNARNLQRCLLSTGYLALMLWLLLLAILAVFFRPARGRDLAAPLLFLAGLAVLFAAVGNRGLIRDSVHFARYAPPPPENGRQLELDVVAGATSVVRLFADTGDATGAAGSTSREARPDDGLQVLRFPLPDRPLRALRLDPGDGRVAIRGIRVVNAGKRTRVVLAPADLVPAAGAAAAGPAPLEGTPAAVARINAALAPPRGG